MKHIDEDIKDERRDAKKYSRRAREFPKYKGEFHELSDDEKGHANKLKSIRRRALSKSKH